MHDLRQTEKRLAVALESIVKGAVRVPSAPDLNYVDSKLINRASALLNELFPTGNIEPEGYALRK